MEQSQFLLAAYPWVLGFLGTVFGSFANVVIWRAPRGESVLAPPSHCPACGHGVRWYDNIPVLSWFVLRGRCRDCSAPIAARYPLVEAIGGALWLAAGLRFGLSWQSLGAAALFWFLLVLTFIDLDTMRLPNPIVGALAAVGLVGAALSQVTGDKAVPLVGLAVEGVWASPLAVALAGAVLGAGASGAIAAAYAALRGRQGMGMGDVKLLAAMGLFVGAYSLGALMAGSIVGAVVGGVAAARGRTSLQEARVPFGPFLAIGCVVMALAGPESWSWYLSLLAWR